MKVNYPEHTCSKLEYLWCLHTGSVNIPMDNISWWVLPSGKPPPYGGNVHYCCCPLLLWGFLAISSEVWYKHFMHFCFVFQFHSNAGDFLLVSSSTDWKLFPVVSGSMLAIATWILYLPVNCITVWSFPFWWNPFRVSSRHLLITSSSSEQKLQSLPALPAGRAWYVAKLALQRSHHSA